MRFTYLDLLAFGHFTGYRVEFLPDRSFHLIYGSNEAGKSTFLRAISDVLYGIPERTNDAFLHQTQNLRIGAGIKRTDGAELTFLRRKGRSKTLLDLNDSPLDKAVLDAFLAGIDKQTFEMMFGLNHQRLTAGGKELLQSGGNLGESLFSASSGISGLRNLLDELDGEMRKLFLPTGQKPIINAEVARYKDARSKVNEASLSSRDWAQLELAYHKQEDEVTALIGLIKELSEKKTRLERVRRALPLLSNRRRCEAELSQIGDVPSLPETARQERLMLQQELRTAEDAQQKAEGRLAILQADKAKLNIPTQLVAHKDEISKLSEGLGQYRQDLANLPKIQGEIAQLEQSVVVLLRELYPQASSESEVAKCRPAMAEIEKTKALAAQHSELLVRFEQSEKELVDITNSLDENQAKRDRLVSRKDPKELRHALSRAQKKGDLEEQLGKLAQEMEQAEKQLNLELQKLPLWEGNLADLATLPLPLVETVERFAERMEAQRQELAEIDKDRERMRQQIAEITKRLNQIKHQGDVPCDADLTAARAHREAGWQLVRQAWLVGSPNVQAEQAYSLDRPLPEAYEAAVGNADEVVDRMRLASTQVAEKTSLLADLETVNQQLAELEDERKVCEAAGDTLATEWQSVWQPSGISPLFPKEMLAWLGQQEKIVGYAANLHLLQSTAATIDQEIADHRAQISAALIAQGETVLENERLADLILRGTEVCSSIDKALGSLQSLADEADSLRSRLKSAERQKAQDEKNLTEWRDHWTKAMERLQLPADTLPAVAVAFLGKLGQLYDLVKILAANRLKQEQLLRAVSEYEQQTTGLLAKVSIKLPGVPPDLAVVELKNRSEQAGLDQATLRQIEAQISEYGDALRDSVRTSEVATNQLQQLMAAANCTDLTELENTEELSARAVGLRQKIAELDEQLIENGGGLSLQAIMAEGEGVNPDTLPGELAEIEWKLDQLDQERSQLEQLFGATKKEYQQKVHGASTVSTEAAEEAENILAALEGEVAQYARLRLAAAVLRMGIEQYREQNQSPVISIAGVVFSRLTLGSFAGLRVDYDANDNPVLLGVRPSGEAVGVEGMSDGTQDQLYLALRLASIEQYLQQAEPMPLVVDDILVNFDDERSRETLRVLADLSERTQLIFFTHHRSLVELAKAEVAESRLAVYSLKVS